MKFGAILGLVLFAGSASGMGFVGTAVLSGSEEVPEVITEAVGEFSITLIDDDIVGVELLASGLSGPPTGAHIHLAPAGVNGAVVLALPLAPSSLLTAADLEGPMAGMTIADLIFEINAGNAYINVHTDENPGGEIRGQIEGDDAFRDTISLSGANEVPAVETDGSGQVRLKLKPKNGNMKFRVKAQDLSSAVVGVHIHLGAEGSNGPVIAVLFDEPAGVDANGTIAEGVLRDSDLTGPLEGLTIDDLVVEMRNGNAYVNLHTVDVPSGEIRGQVDEDLIGLPQLIERLKNRR